MSEEKNKNRIKFYIFLIFILLSFNFWWANRPIKEDFIKHLKTHKINFDERSISHEKYYLGGRWKVAIKENNKQKYVLYFSVYGFFFNNYWWWTVLIINALLLLFIYYRFYGFTFFGIDEKGMHDK